MSRNYEEGRLTDSIGVRNVAQVNETIDWPFVEGRGRCNPTAVLKWNYFDIGFDRLPPPPRARSLVSVCPDVYSRNLSIQGPPSALSRRSMANVTWILGKMYRMVHLSLSRGISFFFFFFGNIKIRDETNEGWRWNWFLLLVRRILL